MRVTTQVLEEKSDAIGKLSERMFNVRRSLPSMTVGQFKEARKAYLVSLSKEQGNLIHKLTGTASWGDIVAALEAAARYVSDVEKVTLDPTRTELLGRLKTWLHDIGVSETQEAEDWFYASMSGAGRDTLEEFGGKLESVQAFSKLLTEPILSHFRKATNNELGLLKKQERNNENLAAWMDKLTQTMLQAIELQKVLASTKHSAGTQYKTTPGKEAVDKFFNVADSVVEHLDSQATNFDKAHEAWRQARETVEREWKLLTPKLTALSQQYRELINSAKPLVAKEIGDWVIKVPSDLTSQLDKLAALVGETIESQQAASDVEANMSSIAQDLGALPSELSQLRDEISRLGQNVAKVKLSSTLTECLASLKTLSLAYATWLKEAEQMHGQWLRKAKSWVSIAKREGTKVAPKLVVRITEMEAYTVNQDRFGKLAALCIEVERLADELRKELREKLTGDQIRLLDIVTGLEAKMGNINVNDIEKDFGKLGAKQLTDLLDLSKKKLISMRVSTKEEYLGS